MKWSNDVNAFMPDDVIYHILLCLSVKSLLRFKSVRKSWRAMIESSDFINEHVHYHHYDRPSLKRENHNLIFCLGADETPITFLITSVDKFEAPTKYLQLDFPNLHEHLPAHVVVAIVHGIVCLHIIHQCNDRMNTICLWNPATKQYRHLPESPFSPFKTTVVGFGFDVKTNDYKVVKLIQHQFRKERHVEVYSLSTGSWRSIDTLLPVNYLYNGSANKPFHNGTRIYWAGGDFEFQPQIICFDFSFEKFRSISFPNCDGSLMKRQLSTVSDKLACVFIMSTRDDTYAEIWVFNDYGSMNESWAKLYKIEETIISKLDRSCIGSICLSMDGNYFFFGDKKICRYDVVTEEIKCFSAAEFQENLKDCRLPKINYFLCETFAEFKESLISVGGRNDAPTSVIQSS